MVEIQKIVDVQLNGKITMKWEKYNGMVKMQ